MTLASRIAVMHKGSLQQFDEPQRIYDRPANLFVAGFMGSPAMNFIPAKLGSKDGTPAVFFPGSGNETVALQLAKPVAASAGSDVILGIRPEHVSRLHGASRPAPGFDSFSAAVEVVEPTGAETIAILRLGAREFTARFTPSQAPKMGETTTLAVDMGQACLFDARTELLIS